MSSTTSGTTVSTVGGTTGTTGTASGAVEEGPVRVLSHPLTPRLVRVERVRWLTPRMVRVTFAGGDLAGFRTAGPEDHVKVFVPADPDGVPAMPVVEDDRWVNHADPALVCRDYTVRAFRPGALELDVDFVAHDHGVVGAWASRARPGQRVGLLGPRGSVVVDDVFDTYVMAVDETALPAMANWLERLRPQASVRAFVEVADAADVQELTAPADTRVTWLERGGAEPGTTTLLADAVRALLPDRAGLPDGSLFAWVAGESLSIKPLRRHFSRTLGLHRDQYDVDGYWRRSVADHDHHGDDDEG